MSLDKITKILATGTESKKDLEDADKELAHMDLSQLESLSRTDGISKPAFAMISNYVRQLKLKKQKELEEKKKAEEEQERAAKQALANQESEPTSTFKI